MNLRSRTHTDILLGILLLTDLLFIVAHILFLTTPYVFDNNYSIVAERGFAETFQYIKAYWIVLMLLWMVVTIREFSYLAWAAVFAYMGADDLLEIHEEVGNTLAINQQFPELLGQRPRDLGELVVFGIAGAVLLSLLALAYYRGSGTFRRHSKPLFLASGLLVFFGIAIDAIHILFLETVADHPFAILEDGGEMIALSLICWYVFRLLSSERVIEWETDELPVIGAHLDGARQRERIKTS